MGKRAETIDVAIEQTPVEPCGSAEDSGWPADPDPGWMSIPVLSRQPAASGSG
jgi:hypothetical protein